MAGRPLLGVAKYKKDLWVAAGQFGLFKRVGTQNKLKCVKPNMQAVDGKEFEGAGDDYLLEQRAGIELGRFES